MQLGFEQRKDVAIEALEAARNVSRFAEQRGHVRRNAAVVVGRRPVGLELSLGVIDQAGVAAELQAARPHLQLDGEIQLALQPGFDDHLPAILQGMGQPALLGRQHLRFPEPNGVVTRQTEGFLGHDPVMTAPANGRNGFESAFEGVHRYADLVLGAKPGFGGRPRAVPRRCAFCRPLRRG